jgi:radical SAM C-methyltransferase
VRARNVLLVEAPGEHGYLPIASGYLAAYALADPRISEAFRFTMNFDHTHTSIDRVLSRILAGPAPDVVGFSCQGWSVRRADALARRLRALHPGVTTVYGGNHVSHQAPDFFGPRPFVDVLVNGEGEATFRELLLRLLEAPSTRDLDDIPGLAFTRPDGEVVVGPPRPRIKDLDEIPSPYLTGVLDPRPETANTVLLETNRGCPYLCSFCYWGEAVGQKLHQFSSERLIAEMEFLARREIDSWFISDANFGIFPRDVELVGAVVALHEQYGFPKTLHTNWAKNSNERIVELCARLNAGGVHSTYTLALQSTTEAALEGAHRSNMKINKIDEIARLCREHDIVPRGELIWGLPGESYNDFLGSYDDLAEHTDALAIYPLYILPNTQYAERMAEFGIVAERGELDTDYAYCVSHNEMPRRDFLKGLRFIISNNILKVGSGFFRLYPRVAKAAAGIPYHQVIAPLGEWILSTDDPTAARFRKYYRLPLTAHRQSIGEAWHAIVEDQPALIRMFRRYVEEVVHSNLDAETAHALLEAFRFDAATHPRMDAPRLERSALDGCYVAYESFDYDLLAFKRGQPWSQVRRDCLYRIASPAGLWRYPLDSWYFGLLSFQGQVTYADADGLAASSSRLAAEPSREMSGSRRG